MYTINLILLDKSQVVSYQSDFIPVPTDLILLDNDRVFKVYERLYDPFDPKSKNWITVSGDYRDNE